MSDARDRAMSGEAAARPGLTTLRNASRAVRSRTRRRPGGRPRWRPPGPRGGRTGSPRAPGSIPRPRRAPWRGGTRRIRRAGLPAGLPAPDRVVVRRVDDRVELLGHVSPPAGFRSASMSRMAEDGDGTRVVRAGLPDPAAGEPFLPGPVFAGPFHLPARPGRHGVPVRPLRQPHLAPAGGGHRRVGGRRGAGLLLWDGGDHRRARVAAAPRRHARHVPADGYYPARDAAQRDLADWGVPRGDRPHRLARPGRGGRGGDPGRAREPVQPGARRVRHRPPSAPPRAGPGRSWPSTTPPPPPSAQRPLALGAHISMASDTKALSGPCRPAARPRRLGRPGARHRARPDPAHPHRRHRGVPSRPGSPIARLPPSRCAWTGQCATALGVAEALRGAPGFSQVRYPGLPDTRARGGRAPMRRFGAGRHLRLAGPEAAERFLAAARLVHEATSFGGVHSSAERRGRWGGDDVRRGAHTVQRRHRGHRRPRRGRPRGPRAGRTGPG